MKKILFALLLLVFIVAPVSAFPLTAENDSIARAVNYLDSNQDSSTAGWLFDTGWGVIDDTPWAVQAIEAAGNNSSTWIKNETNPVAYLIEGAGSLSSVTDYSKYILALVVVDQDPRDVNGKNIVLELKRLYNTSGSFDSVANNIWATLALVAAGEPTQSSAVQNSVDYLRDAQNADFGWGYAVDVGSDTDDTAAVIFAMRAADVPANDTNLTNALIYLRGNQKLNGGFFSDPVWVPNANADSTARVMQALNALNHSPDDWDTRTNATPTSFLLSLQRTDGGFNTTNNSEGFLPYTTTINVILALLGETFPIQRLDTLSYNTVFEIIDTLVEVNQSGTALIRVRVTNTGALEDVVTVAASSSSGWGLNLNASTVYLDVGESAELLVNVSVPGNAGRYDAISFTATSLGGALNVWDVASLQVNDVSDVVNVGVVVDFSNGVVVSECVELSKGDSGKNALLGTTLETNWTFGGLALHCVNTVCGWENEFWAFKYFNHGDADWTNSMVGFTYYFIEDKDVIGAKFTPMSCYGVENDTCSFPVVTYESICEPPAPVLNPTPAPSGGPSGGFSVSATTPAVPEPTPAPEPTTIDLGDTLTSTAKTSVTLSVGSTASFTLEEKHTLEVKEVTESTAIIELRSEPIEVTLAIGESQRVDLSSNGIEDLEVSLISIINGEAEFILEKIVVEQPAPIEVVELVQEETAPTGFALLSSGSTAIGALVFAALVAVLVYIYKRKRSVY